MTPEQAKLVANSFAQLESRLPELGAAVYDTLFYIAPDTRAMFKGDMVSQHKKLVNVLVEFVKLRRRSQHFLPATDRGGEAVVPGIDRLRSGHKASGVKSEHYALMRNAILNSLAAMLGDKLDERTAEAWGAAFDTLAETMQRPESATLEEINLLSSMFGRRFEGTNDSAASRDRSPSADDFFEKE
ncbi:MAG: globin domain-containing protein [Rhodomicrobium sp.]